MIYQLTLVIRSTLKEAEQKKLLEGIKSLLGKAKITEKSWGQKALAYPIRKEVSGLFLNWNIDSESVVPLNFEKKLLGNDDILRHLLLRR
ncbi:MAG: 30S ribosomal protein S6 [Candidatus Levybacteria bacterium]|nr:30S ribosomal protein S6 [Candidatus Levybacteria bacterium]